MSGVHEHRLFRICDGKFAGQYADQADFDWLGDAEDDDVEWPSGPPDTGEFDEYPDGWYWQWRRVPADAPDTLGIALGPLNGPFDSEAAARAHEADPANAHRGIGGVFPSATGHPGYGIATTGPFDFEEE
jgi:hypothetical protein